MHVNAAQQLLNVHPFLLADSQWLKSHAGDRQLEG